MVAARGMCTSSFGVCPSSQPQRETRYHVPLPEKIQALLHIRLYTLYHDVPRAYSDRYTRGSE